MSKNKRFKNLPLIQTKRLILRCTKLSDAKDTFEFASDPQVTQYNFWHTHHSLRDSQELLSWLTDEDFACWSILRNICQKVIGICFLHSFNLQHRRAEIAFNLSRRHWGQGYATESVSAIIRFAFEKWNLNRIEGTCMLDNMASARVMEKVDMKFEGILRQHSLAKNKFHDLKLYSILRNEIQRTRETVAITKHSENK